MRNGRKVGSAIIAIGVAASMLTMTACGTAGENDNASQSNGKIQLTFTGWVPGIESAVDLWNKNNPNIHVNFKRIASESRKNYSTLIEAGTAGDILQMSAFEMIDYVIDQQIMDISKYVGDKKDLFTDGTWSTVSINGGIYGIPQDSAPTAFMYRKDIFEQYGVRAPKTWDEYLVAARKLHKANPNVYIAAFTPNVIDFFESEFLQEGGSWYTVADDTWKVTLDSPQTRKIAERYQTLLDEGLVKTMEGSTPEFWAAVNNGEIASFNYLPWFTTILKEHAPDLSGKWAIAQSPSDSGNGPWSDDGGGANVITKNCKYPEQAAKFITWLNSDPESVDILITKGGLFPAAKTGLKSSEMVAKSDYFGGQPLYEKFIESANNLNTKGGIGGPAIGVGHTALKDEFGKVGNGEETFKEALTNTSAKLKKAAVDKGLSVQ